VDRGVQRLYLTRIRLARWGMGNEVRDGSGMWRSYNWGRDRAIMETKGWIMKLLTTLNKFKVSLRIDIPLTFYTSYSLHFSLNF
jgi:hypothetical protein